MDGFTFSPKLDCLGRNRGKTVETGGHKIAEEQITYLKFGDHATNIPATVYFGDVKNGRYCFSDHFKYKYDSMGNITEIRENGELYAKYTYDTIGRLVREDNKKLGKTTTFTYDTNGNILCRKEYAFTLTDKLDELDCTDFVYTYDGDKLLSYNGEACEYDAIGNPTTYRGLKARWANGRQLSSYNNTPFTYDNLGRRISKNSVTFTYDANGNLIRQNNGISFIYDASGVCGICYGNSTYFYRKDILGNIVAILDANGEIVAKYTYDAWGNHTITDTNGNVITDENHIANLNPFRYRGYYYDTGIGLYFLKTRYYDPEIGRFMTIDDLSYLDPDSINGLNLYAYCLNNPIMCVDPNGHLAISIGLLMLIGFVVGAAIGAGSSAIGQFAGNGFTFEGFNWGQFALDTFLGGISGMLSMSPLGVGAMVVANAAIGFVGAVGGHLMNGSDFTHYSTWLDIALSTGLGALAGRIGGAGGLNSSYLNGATKTAGFIRAAGMYDDVLTKAANGFYKTSDIAKNALRLSHNNLMKQWNRMIVTHSGAALKTSLIRTGILLPVGTLVKGLIYYYTKQNI